MFLLKNFITRPFLTTVIIFAVIHILKFLVKYDVFMVVMLMIAGAFSLWKKEMEED